MTEETNTTHIEETTSSHDSTHDAGLQVKSPMQTSPRNEVSAATVGRMMGLATAAELQLIESKIDLLTTKFSATLVKVEKILTALSNVPSGGDLERIDVQIGSLRSQLQEFLADLKTKNGGTASPE